MTTTSAGPRLCRRPAAALCNEACVKLAQVFRRGDVLRLIPLRGTQPRSGKLGYWQALAALDKIRRQIHNAGSGKWAAADLPAYLFVNESGK